MKSKIHPLESRAGHSNRGADPLVKQVPVSAHPSEQMALAPVTVAYMGHDLVLLSCWFQSEPW